jgi:hypothetical protein
VAIALDADRTEIVLDRAGSRARSLEARALLNSAFEERLDAFCSSPT